ncbi:hypothetical protein [Luteolibacter marinus]|uniref:hypothetical protein n=1 Tax=Luteolibacter marinus TaxID=2776705 RepID=UPI00186698A8|nr:hypothetical protein [Luteolibacter marinus]
MNLARPALLAAVSTALAGAHPHEEPPVEASQEERAAITGSKVLTVSEGLPHPAKEPHLYPAEEKRRDTRKLADFPFYKPDLKPDAGRVDRLRKLLADPGSYLEWKQKRCGGFHPDWSVNWRAGRKEIHALICFGCQDIIIAGPDQQLRYGLSPAAFKQLQSELIPLRSKRPGNAK